ncbi:MAG: M55 family metallopeptidase [Fidelibacterota bacterium]|nr:MAG: M55 family metallopeptidase [Candidatus Neomarinimicrobiota bacterium]
MKRVVRNLSVLLGCVLLTHLQGKDGIKVFISVDMEGISGVANWEDVRRDGQDYEYFRTIMTKEANAAIEGALEAGAEEIWVRDSHATARNLLPEMLNRNARLLRDWSGGYKSMMEGIDESFDAVIFIGYHSKAGTPNALLEHTMSSKNITDVSINGVSLPEAGINGLIAGHYNVPVVFIAGERAVCDQAKGLFGTVETVAVKEGIGNAALCLHPEVAREQIRAGVSKALGDLKRYKPYKLKPPYRLVVKLKNEELVHEKSYYPGVERTGDWELTFKSSDLLEVMRAFQGMH